MRQVRVVTGYVLLSSLAGGLLLLVSWMGGLTGNGLVFGGWLTVALTFIMCCILGILLAIGRRRLVPSKRRGELDRKDRGGGGGLVGHHPNCGKFGDSIVVLRGKAWCAGCLGLSLGCALSIAIMIAILLGAQIAPESGLLIMVMGLFIVASCLVEVEWHPSDPRLHVLSNIGLVIGFLLVTIGTTSATSSTMFGLLAILICFLWLDTRIQISEWRNAKVCDACGESCKRY